MNIFVFFLGRSRVFVYLCEKFVDMIDNDTWLLSELKQYCKDFNVPTEFVFEILRDQKVIPMIRGKATEYNAYLYLKEVLNHHTWDVQKLNLNAQNDAYDEDVSITHRPSGIRLKVECKNACRGSFKDGIRTKVLHQPHFKVKCHRSRSNMSKTTNDRYLVGEFDLLMTNTSNALYQDRTDDYLELLDNERMIEILYNYYHVHTDRDLIDCCNNDWRFAIPSEIAKNGVIPRTPYVALQNDGHWFNFNRLDGKLRSIVDIKKQQRRGRSR